MFGRFHANVCEVGGKVEIEGSGPEREGEVAASCRNLSARR